MLNFYWALLFYKPEHLAYLIQPAGQWWSLLRVKKLAIHRARAYYCHCCAESLFAETMSLCDCALRFELLCWARAYTFIFMFILLFVGGSLDYQKEFLLFILIFTRPLQATVMLSLNFCWDFMSLCDYTSVPWGFNTYYAKPEPIPLFLCSFYYSWEVVLTTKRNFYFLFLFSLGLYKPLLCWVSIFAETMSLCDYTSVPWGFNTYYPEPESLYLYFYVYIIIRGKYNSWLPLEEVNKLCCGRQVLYVVSSFSFKLPPLFLL